MTNADVNKPFLNFFNISYFLISIFFLTCQLHIDSFQFNWISVCQHEALCLGLQSWVREIGRNTDIFNVIKLVTGQIQAMGV
jgi:hypothetical protein